METKCSQRVGHGPNLRRQNPPPVSRKVCAGWGSNIKPTGPALVHVGLAVASVVAWCAIAAVGPHGVVARGGIATGAFHTLVDVHLTWLTWKRWVCRNEFKRLSSNVDTQLDGSILEMCVLVVFCFFWVTFKTLWLKKKEVFPCEYNHYKIVWKVTRSGGWVM